MARAWPRPVGSGALMWNASAVRAPPRTSAIGVRTARQRVGQRLDDDDARRPRRARTRRASGRTAARRSPGRSLRFESAVMLPSAATPIGTTGASEPPVRTTSHSPVRMSRRASWKAMTDVAHAATWVMTGPVSPYSIESRHARHRPRQRRHGERADEPRTLAVLDVRPVDDLLDPAAAGVDDDADAVALLRLIAAKSMPESRTASLPAPIARWMKRDHPAGHLRVHDGGRVEVEDLGRDLDLDPRRIEALDSARPGDPGDEVRPVRREVVADRHDRRRDR